MTKSSIPADFPREQVLGAVAGAQPKLTACLVDGKYVAGRTDEEHLER